MELPLVRTGEVICSTDALPDGTSLKFRILEGGREVEAFVIGYAGHFYAYKNRCAHMALTLDLDDNDFFTIDHRALICKTHGATYYPENGICFSGPCYGESLDALRVEVRNNGIVLLPSEDTP